jgi:hypothetical protein
MIASLRWSKGAISQLGSLNRQFLPPLCLFYWRVESAAIMEGRSAPELSNKLRKRLLLSV